MCIASFCSMHTVPRAFCEDPKCFKAEDISITDSFPVINSTSFHFVPHWMEINLKSWRWTSRGTGTVRNLKWDHCTAYLGHLQWAIPGEDEALQKWNKLLSQGLSPQLCSAQVSSHQVAWERTEVFDLHSLRTGNCLESDSVTSAHRALTVEGSSQHACFSEVANNYIFLFYRLQDPESVSKLLCT